MLRIQANEIGGAVVRRTFTAGGKRLVSGMTLTGDEVRAFAPPNRQALIEKQFIDVYPANGQASKGKSDRFVVSAGFGRFDVIEGRKLNGESLDREQAYALAGIPEPKQRKRGKNGNG